MKNLLLLAAAIVMISTQAQAKGVKEQIDSNTARIEALEQKTTLSDIPCNPDEVAKFDGAQWVCVTPESLHPLVYEVSRTVVPSTDPALQVISWHGTFCNLGDQAIGGGVSLPPEPTYNLHSSHAESDPRGWRIGIRADPGAFGPLDATLYTYCLDLTP